MPILNGGSHAALSNQMGEYDRRSANHSAFALILVDSDDRSDAT